MAEKANNNGEDIDTRDYRSLYQRTDLFDEYLNRSSVNYPRTRHSVEKNAEEFKSYVLFVDSNATVEEVLMLAEYIHKVLYRQGCEFRSVIEAKSSLMGPCQRQNLYGENPPWHKKIFSSVPTPKSKSLSVRDRWYSLPIASDPERGEIINRARAEYHAYVMVRGNGSWTHDPLPS